MKDQTETKTILHEEGEKVIHLFAGGAVPGDSVLRIRWCLCRSILDRLKELLVKNPCLLLVVTSTSKENEVYRKIVPLEQEMEYVYFSGPGQHRVLATILWDESGDEDALRKKFGEKRYGQYGERAVLNYSGYFEKGLNRGMTIGQGELLVEVSKEFFAKEPSEWLRRWVNLWFETKPFDQCQFRRRSILAFTLQLVVIPLWIIFLCSVRFLIAAFFVLCGLRRINFVPIVHPFKRDTEDLWIGMIPGSRSVFFRTVEDKWGGAKWRPCFLWPFVPIFPLVLFLDLLGSSFFLGFEMGIWKISGITLSIILGLSFLLLVAYSIVYLFKRLLSGLAFLWRSSWGEYELKTRGQQRQAERAKMYKEEERGRREKQKTLLVLEQSFLPMVCTGIPLKAALNKLPSEKITVYLRFMNLKARVCKPFARY